MKKIASLLCLFILFVTIQPVQAKEIQLFSKYYYLYDRSNEMVYLDEKSDEKNLSGEYDKNFNSQFSFG